MRNKNEKKKMVGIYYANCTLDEKVKIFWWTCNGMARHLSQVAQPKWTFDNENTFKYQVSIVLARVNWSETICSSIHFFLFFLFFVFVLFFSKRLTANRPEIKFYISIECCFFHWVIDSFVIVHLNAIVDVVLNVYESWLNGVHSNSWFVTTKCVRMQLAWRRMISL